MNKEVNFELAKLLKEKGYDIPTKKYYEYALKSRKNKEDGYSGSFGWKKGELNLQSDYFQNNSKSDFTSEMWYMCSAPTITEVVMWLYEKHGIWIIVDCDCYGILWYANLSVASEKNWDNIDLRHEIISASKKFPNEHNSPTEAYEAAIEYTLNNLI